MNNTTTQNEKPFESAKSYTDTELQELAISIDKEKYNNFYQSLVGEIYSRQLAGKYKPSKTLQEKFQESLPVGNELRHNDLNREANTDEQNNPNHKPVELDFAGPLRFSLDNKIDETFNLWATTGETEVFENLSIVRRRIIKIPHSTLISAYSAWSLYVLISQLASQSNLGGGVLPQVAAGCILFALQLFIALMFYYQTYAGCSYNVSIVKATKFIYPNNDRYAKTMDFDAFLNFFLLLVVDIVFKTSSVDFAIRAIQ